ncbi:MAG TPA: condensation domain-containing protein, partial [Ktedonobacteraceae bacterium]|nr:condensation domain-containing protein [Ktedonobacteraceae bacterium]
MSFENVDDIYVLSPLQQGMLFHELYTPCSEAYTFQTSWTLSGTLNSSLLRLSWQKVVDQHPVLRTGFVWEGLDKPLQVVHQRIEVPWEQHDWRSLPAHEQDIRWEQFLEADRARAFPLDEAPLMRLALFQLTENAYRLVWSYHHLLLDGWSYPQVLKEVLDIYNALVQGRTLTPAKRRPYRDYIAWLQEQDLSQAEAFWRQRLKGFIAPTRLTVDQMPVPGIGQHFAEQRWIIPEEITTALQVFARMHQLTLNTLVQGAWALLLSYYSGELDLVYGTVVSGRPVTLAGMESMIGLFVNTLPVRVRLSAEETLLFWLKALQLQQVELRQYEYSPLVQVQHWSDVPHGSPLFESILAFENYPTGMLTPEQESGLTLTSLSSFGHTHYPLELIVIPRDTLTLRLSYATGRFAAETMERLPGHFQNLLEGMLTHATQPLAALSILSTTERQMMLKTWNATSQPGVAANGLQAGVCLHHLVEAQVERTPDALAVTFEQQRLTYRQLNERANQLAHHLRRLGIGAESIVGVFMERSLDMVIALLGILKAGGAYTPLDPAFPSERLAFVLADLKADTSKQAIVLLTQGHLVASLPFQDAHVICLDEFWDQLSLERSDNLAGDVTGANLAYVIYTSGSTGQPKGVMNSHQGICNRLLWMQTVSPLSAVDCVMQKTPFSFDISVWEFFWPLITGARLAVARPGGQKESAYLIELIQQQQVTTLHFVPSMLQIFLEEP